MKRDSIANTFFVASVLCVVCSVLVSAAAVGLRPWQQENRQLEKMKNILSAAGLYEPDVKIEATYQERVTQRLVDLETGEFVPIEGDVGNQTVTLGDETIKLSEYNPLEVLSDEQLSDGLTAAQDKAGIKRREKYAPVYFIDWKTGSGSPAFSQVILPVRGKGLWSTLYGFLALDADLNTVRGLTFYEHGETPGLGGEVDNPSWKAKWIDKEVFDESQKPVIEVVKGSVDFDAPDAEHKVDGLAGATITSRGVTNLLRFWLGENGFGPFLERLSPRE